MKTLEINQLEDLQGGYWNCAGTVLGIVGLAGAVLATPVTGGISLWIAVQAGAAAVGTGISMAVCAYELGLNP